jgi:predicted CxxxxCH...CXXCH cytochrome family protein
MKKTIYILLIISLHMIYCSKMQDTLEVSTHPADWNNPNSEIFHAEVVYDNGPESCQSCHGYDYKGGTSGVSCYTCHPDYPHQNGFSDPNSMNFHGNYIREVTQWDLIPCQSCHGVDYSGGANGVSCKTSGCHVQPDGPEACNTCHGNFSQLISITQIAPPEDLNKNVTHEATGVGAHQMHVAQTMVTNPYNCKACHPQVINFDDPIHVDESFASVIFDALATDNGRLNPVWDRTTVTCSEVYCHGAFQFQSGDSLIVGNSTPVVWTNKVANPEDCVFCHSLPPQGHEGQGQYNTPGSCAQCHGSVVNSNGEIINKNLHINGFPNFW